MTPAQDVPGPSQPEPGGPQYPASGAEHYLAASVTAYLLSGPLTFGGLGWLLDHWLGTGFLMVAGLVSGMVMSIYVIWLRYGSQ